MESIFSFLKKTFSINVPAEQALKGFTLVEMLIVLAIMVIVTSIALFGQNTFNKSLILNDVSYNLAFTIRQAQSLGLSSRKIGTVTNAGYGVQVKTGSTDAYTLFADTMPALPGSDSGGLCAGHTAPLGSPDAKPGNCLYTDALEKVESTSFTRGFTISRFCELGVPNPRCSGTDFDSLHISFTRPSTQAVIIGMRGGTLTRMSNVGITIASPDGTGFRCVRVSAVGEISVTDSCP